MERMDIESADDYEEEELQLEVVPQRYIKKLELSTQAERMANSILNKRRSRVVQLNKGIDTTNSALRYQLNIKTKQIRNFEHFLTRNKFRSERVLVFDAVRELAESRNYALNGRVNMKLQRSRMVLRVVAKEDMGVVLVEDQTGKQKMTIKYGTIWVGMIALMQVTWADNCYKLQAVLDLGPRFQKMTTEIKTPNASYRMLFVKGSFMNHQSKDNIGLKILLNEITQLRDREKTRVNCVVIMGPLLHKKNKILTGFLEKTFDQEMEDVTKLIRDEINKISDQIEIVYVPSTDDITNIYPIPQPVYSHSQQFKSKNTLFTSNPGFIHLSGRQNIKIDVINSDVLGYIDQNRTGRSTIDIMQQNLETYFKQPFYLTNSTEQPFDEINIPSLYNEAKFGDIIVTSSRKSPPFARQVRGKVFLNIGCLNMQEGDQNTKNYMTLVSIFDGSGHLSGRTKVERLGYE